jgi:predicted aminopeptidase
MLPVLLSGCATVNYYAQAIGGHLELMREARSIEEQIADPQTPAPLREKLQQAQRMRQFAVDELGLPENGSYRRYADLKRPFVVWNVFAAPEFSVTPVKSCFPIAGCVDYRGWYNEARARHAAAELKAAGNDVFVGGVPAYSTLGWFDDPLLNTFMVYPEGEVARLIFHELAHQVAYVRDDTVFNESFAVAVEEEGLRRWLTARADRDGERRYAANSERRRQFVALMLDYRRRLQSFYMQELPEAERRAGKAAIFAELSRSYGEMRQSWGGFGGFDRFFAQGPNNAMLASIAAYSGKLPAFRALLKRQGGDLPAFYQEVKRLAARPRAERDAVLNALAPQ